MIEKVYFKMFKFKSYLHETRKIIRFILNGIIKSLNLKQTNKINLCKTTTKKQQTKVKTEKININIIIIKKKKY